MIRNKFIFLFQAIINFYIICIIISLITTKEISKTESTTNDNIDKTINNDNTKSKINFINCDKFCSKFEPTCPEIYNEVIKLSTEYIIENNLISNENEKNNNIPFEIPKAFYYKGIYEYYGIISEKSNPNLETGLANFIIASYFGSKEANYRLYILYESDLISHIIYTKKFKKIIEQDKLLQLIQKTDFWNNFDFFYKYPTTNSTNENIRRNLQNQIGYNFLYLSILKKYNPALLVGGTKYSTGIGVEKNCEVATQFIKEVSFQNIAGKINHPEIKGNFLFARFRLETYESIEGIYKKENQLSSLENLLQVLNMYKEEKDLPKKKEVINEIGIRYFYGVDTDQDYHKAKEWFEKGLQYNIGQCYAFLGEIYLHGFGLRKEEVNYKKAFDYFEKAMTYGESGMGYSGMGYMYYYGLGVKKDKKEAYNCFLKGIRSSKKDSSWEITSLYFNMISLLIEDDSEDEEENFEFRDIFNDMFVDFDIEEKDEINNNLNLLTEKKEKKEKKEEINKNIINDINKEKDKIDKNNNDNIKNKEKEINIKDLKNKKEKDKDNNKDKDKDKEAVSTKVPKDFNLAYKYANYLTLKNRSYGTYILAMMNDYNINSKLFSCEENLNFFRSTSDTNIETINRVKLSRKLYENKKYKSAFLIMMELGLEGHEDSLPNVVSILIKRQIFKEHGYQKYLTHYFIELGLKLEFYDLYFLSLGASFFYKEKKYDKAIELYKLLINHAGGNDKKLYIAEGFFNLGLMENFGYGIPKNLTKSKNFFEKAQKYEANCYYPVWWIKLLNKFMKIFGKKGYDYEENFVKNETVVNNNSTRRSFGKIRKILENVNILSIAVFFFLIFYGWFFFNIKFQGTDADH